MRRLASGGRKPTDWLAAKSTIIGLTPTAHQKDALFGRAEYKLGRPGRILLFNRYANGVRAEHPQGGEFVGPGAHRAMVQVVSPQIGERIYDGP